MLDTKNCAKNWMNFAFFIYTVSHWAAVEHADETVRHSKSGGVCNCPQMFPWSCSRTKMTLPADLVTNMKHERVFYWMSFRSGHILTCRGRHTRCFGLSPVNCLVLLAPVMRRGDTVPNVDQNNGRLDGSRTSFQAILSVCEHNMVDTSLILYIY